MSLKTTAFPAVLIVMCRRQRILAAAHGAQLRDGRITPDPSRWPIELWRWPAGVEDAVLIGDDLLALDAAGNSEPLVSVPCPNHPGGHEVDGHRLAEELSQVPRRTRGRARNIEIRRVLLDVM